MRKITGKMTIHCGSDNGGEPFGNGRPGAPGVGAGRRQPGHLSRHRADARLGADLLQAIPGNRHRRRLGRDSRPVQLNPKTKLDGKTKELIGLAVAAQIPCQYCVYFHTAAAKANGATDEEIREAVAMAAIARHWSTVLNGMQVDYRRLQAGDRHGPGMRPAKRQGRRHARSSVDQITPVAVGRRCATGTEARKPQGGCHVDQDDRDGTGAAIKRAIEGRDGRMLASFYADDAVVRVIDRNNPPSKPREVQGQGRITTFWDDICSRAMTHKVEVNVAEGDRLAFTQACTYPDGAKVFCVATGRARRTARSRTRPSSRPGTSERDGICHHQCPAALFAAALLRTIKASTATPVLVLIRNGLTSIEAMRLPASAIRFDSPTSALTAESSCSAGLPR